MQVAVLYFVNQAYGIQTSDYVGVHARGLRKAPAPAGRHPRRPLGWRLCHTVFLSRAGTATFKPSQFSIGASWRIVEFGSLGHRVLLSAPLGAEPGRRWGQLSTGWRNWRTSVQLTENLLSPRGGPWRSSSSKLTFDTFLTHSFHKYFLRVYWVPNGILGVRIEQS